MTTEEKIKILERLRGKGLISRKDDYGDLLKIALEENEKKIEDSKNNFRRLLETNNSDKKEILQTLFFQLSTL